MKIVHIITRMILGGAQENTLLTCEGLHRKGHDITLITGPALGPEGELLSRAHRGGYQVIEIDNLRREINPFHDIPCYRKLKELIRKSDADIIHTHSAKAGILGRWAAAAVRKEANDACCAPLRNLRNAQASACRRPMIVHTIHGLAFHRYQSALKNWPYAAVERSAARATDAFISVADAMTAQAMAAGIGQPEQFKTIVSGLETASYLADPPQETIARRRLQLDIPPNVRVVITVARLAELKGHEFIIRSAQQIAKRHEDVVWLFVGDGHLRHQIEQQITAAGLSDRFRFTGLVPPDQVPELIHTADILVHCSLREGLARVLPQAMLCGKPVISFDVDGAREVATEKTGILLKPQDVPGLIEAQERLLDDGKLTVRLGRAGRELCRHRFDHQVMVDDIEQLYLRLLRRP